mmetsp:Transcript_24355/g.33813  ORF Transcript_24355/g.33813 Transcript_24355/m.33813 type:complete len:248 (-) Transcript_24355:38-781(-)
MESSMLLYSVRVMCITSPEEGSAPAFTCPVAESLMVTPDCSSITSMIGGSASTFSRNEFAGVSLPFAFFDFFFCLPLAFFFLSLGLISSLTGIGAFLTLIFGSKDMRGIFSALRDWIRITFPSWSNVYGLPCSSSCRRFIRSSSSIALLFFSSSICSLLRLLSIFLNSMSLSLSILISSWPTSSVISYGCSGSLFSPLPFRFFVRFCLLPPPLYLPLLEATLFPLTLAAREATTSVPGLAIILILFL